MVKVRADIPLDANGKTDAAAWVARVCAANPRLDAAPLTDACRWLQTLRAGERYLLAGLQYADMVASLDMDTASLVAALCYRPVREAQASPADVARVFAPAAGLVESVARMATSSLLELTNSPLLESESQTQIENVKRMLVSLIDDARVSVLKLSERVLALQHAKHAEPDRQRRIAEEAMHVFAPLANRLGIGHLRWELEDLALRYLHPEDYRAIATGLNARRESREAEAAAFAQHVQAVLKESGVAATVHGRAKHIHSIWRKMRSKGVDITEVYDVRAVRILVQTIADCYASLGIIHTRWQHIPSEFDDYIASPKGNGYQSIHTAVLGPGGKTLEIQIRTHQMHVESELGLCAHWSYKDAPAAAVPVTVRRDAYSEKMDWLRQVVEWHEELGGMESLGNLLQQQIREERIFIATPKGHVVDLPKGATLLDFAYRVHTEVGHSCRGGAIDGVPANLNALLATGQQVQVHTDKGGKPHREWLESHLGFVVTSRAKAKIHSFLRSRGTEVNIAAGSDYLNDVLESLGEHALTSAEADQMAADFHVTRDEFFYQVAVGEIQSPDAVARLLRGQELVQADLLLEGAASPAGTAVRPAIQRFAIVGDNRQGLLRDIAQLVSDEGLSLVGTEARVEAGTGLALIELEMMMSGLTQPLHMIGRLRQLGGVVSAVRLPVASERRGKTDGENIMNNK